MHLSVDRPVRRRIAGVVLAAVLAGLTVAASPAAAQAGTATITGSTGSPPVPPWNGPVVCVAVYDAATRAFVGGDSSDLAGGYSIPVPPGSYHVAFWPCGLRSVRMPTLHDRAATWPTATVVTVAAGETAAVHAAFNPAARTGGRVVDQFGTPLSSCTVWAFADAPDPLLLSAAITDSAGGYQVWGLLAPTRLGVDCGQGYAPVVTAPFTLTDPSFSEPRPDVVVAQQPRSISGTLSSELGYPDARACVAAFSTSGALVGSTTTTTTGRWILADLPVGPVRIGFHHCSGDNSTVFAPEWWADATDFAGATDVAVLADAPVTGVHATVSRFAPLHGAFMDEAGQLAPGVCMWVTDPAVTTLVGSAYAETGFAKIYAVPGDYKVFASDCGGGWSPEWYLDAADPASAHTVHLTETGAEVLMTLTQA